jgi:hypothetical protein
VAKRPSFSWPTILGLIALLAIVARFIFGGCCMSMSQLKTLQTSDNAKALKQAVEYMESEYLVAPELGRLDFLSDSPEGRQLLAILLGEEEASDSMHNKKEIAFFSAKVNKNKNKGGLVYSGTARRPDGFYDAWGNPFRVTLRNPRTSRLTFLYGGKAVTLDASVAVASKGPDGQKGTKDDITTWAPARPAVPIWPAILGVVALSALATFGIYRRSRTGPQ